VLLALLALQFRRYARAQIYFFDKGFSARAAVLAIGGAHHALGLGGEDAGEGAIAFQPLRRIDDPAHRAWRPNGLQRFSSMNACSSLAAGTATVSSCWPEPR
jgi:type IV secretory pathway VirB4 component